MIPYDQEGPLPQLPAVSAIPCHLGLAGHPEDPDLLPRTLAASSRPGSPSPQDLWSHDFPLWNQIFTVANDLTHPADILMLLPLCPSVSLSPPSSTFTSHLPNGHPPTCQCIYVLSFTL